MHRLAFLIFPRFQLLDIAGPLAAFEVAEAIRPGSYSWRIVAPEPGPVPGSAGVAWAAESLPRIGSFDTLMVSGGDGVSAAFTEARVLRFVRAAAAREATRITSVCSGSMVLAAAGVLDGLPATTHWCRTLEFQRHFPAVKLQPDRIYTQEGRFWTSAGITAGVDMALAMIGQDHGEAVAKRVAKELVVYHRRPGGQSQFSEMLALHKVEGRFGALLHQVRASIHERHDVASLAERACMSPRHFARTFQAETGTTPARAVERLRVEAARAALESGAVPVQRVAQTCGFGDPERMRRSFVRLLGMPPSAVKRASVMSLGLSARPSGRPSTR